MRVIKHYKPLLWGECDGPGFLVWSVDDNADRCRVESGDVDDIVAAVTPVEVSWVRINGDVVEDEVTAMLTCV